MPSQQNRVVLAVAGGRKTQQIIDAALSTSNERVLITTYTRQNLAQLRRRLVAQAGGALPPNLQCRTWFEFLLSEGVRPYQSALFGQTDYVRSIAFGLRPPKWAKIASPRDYFTARRNVYDGRLAHLVCQINAASDGRVIERLERMFTQIYFDEVQDLASYDFDFLELLFRSKICTTAVGDPRQTILSTSNERKNRQFRGAGFPKWLKKVRRVCASESQITSFRCNQKICDFANELFPNFPAMVASQSTATGHDGIFEVPQNEVSSYIHRWQPQVLRHSKRTDIPGIPAMNIGIAKGSTYPRVLVFPTKPMTQYLRDRDASRLKDPERLYVAVTRAVHSVAFVV